MTQFSLMPNGQAFLQRLPSSGLGHGVGDEEWGDAPLNEARGLGGRDGEMGKPAIWRENKAQEIGGWADGSNRKF